MVVESMTSMNHKPQQILLPSRKNNLSLLKPCGCEVRNYEGPEWKSVLIVKSELLQITYPDLNVY